MLRYKLRTLLIVLAVLPPVVAFFWVVGAEVISDLSYRFSRTPYRHWQDLGTVVWRPLVVLAAGAALAYVWHVVHYEPSSK
jgi:hypothetical protein